MELSITSVNQALNLERTSGLSRETPADVPEEEADKASPAEPRYDTYVPSVEQSDAMEPEEDTARKAVPAAGNTLTVDTDNVDQEIEHLEKQRDTLKKELEQAADDPQREVELNRRLSEVEAELDLKNTDAYRRQHADYSGDLT